MKSNKLFAAVLATAVCFGSTVLPFDKAQHSTAYKTVSAAENDSETVTLHIGDVNGDGSIDSSDAADILREYAASLTGQDSVLTDSQKKLADLNLDDSVDSSDAALILMFYAYNSTGGELSIEEYLSSINEPPAVTTTAVSTNATSPTTNTTVSTRVTKTTAVISSQTVSSKTTVKATVSTAKPATKTSTIATKASTTAAPKPPTTVTTNAPTTAATKPPTTTATKPATTSANPTTTSTKPTTTTTKPTTTATPPVTTTTTEPVRVSSIGVTRSEFSINVGEGALAAYVTMFPLNAENKGEIWTSSDESVAIVNSEGWVSGIGEGECVITVKSEDNPEVSAEIKVTVINTRNVKDIRLSRTAMTLQVGYGELAARVTMLPDTAVNKSEIWSSSDTDVATVDGEGWVIAKKAGNAIITVKSADNPAVFAFVLVTVVDSQTPPTNPVTTAPPPPVTTTTTVTTAEDTSTTTTTTTDTPIAVQEIQVSESEITLTVGEQNEPDVQVLPENATNKALNWTSSNDQIASVDQSGKITAVGAGNCTITVSSAENEEIKSDIIVNVKTAGEVTEINLSKYEMTITVGQADISRVTMLPYTAANKDELWSTSDPAIATVDKYGWVKGVSEGECTVTVKSADNPSVKAEIAVKVVSEAVDTPAADFSYIAPGKSTQTEIAFLLPFPANAKGKYSVEYVITAKNGKVSSIVTPTLVVPTVKSAITMLTAETNEFTAEAYLTDLNTNQRAKIGSYSFSINPRDAKTENENIYYAFYLLGGITE